MKRLGEIPDPKERDLNELLESWNNTNGNVVCTYGEAQLLIEFFLMQEVEFRVSPRGEEIMIKKGF